MSAHFYLSVGSIQVQELGPGSELAPLLQLAGLIRQGDAQLELACILARELANVYDTKISNTSHKISYVSNQVSLLDLQCYYLNKITCPFFLKDPMIDLIFSTM